MPYSLPFLALMSAVGTLPLLFLAYLPDINFLLLMLGVALLSLAQPIRILHYIGICGLFSVWALLAAQQALAPLAVLTRIPVVVTAEIVQVLGEKERLIVRIRQYGNEILFPPLYANIANSRVQQIWCAGQRWEMSLRLRPVHGRLNEGSFDAQRFALANSMPLQGTLLAAKAITQRCSVHHHLVSQAQQQYQHLPWHSVMTALLFGDRQGLSADVRDILRDTGIAHLMAISGMHISLAASLGWMVARLLQFLLPAWRISYPLPLLFSLSVAALYCWLSGSNPPAIRALIALTVWAVIRFQHINCNSWQIWLVCIGTILFFDPVTVLSDSFWLSVLAVATLLFWYQWFPLPARWRHRKRWMLLQLAHLQLGMMMLLIPLQALIFHGLSLTSLPANMIAIPVVSFITVPALLLALIMPTAWLALPLWWLADRSLALVFYLLAFLPEGWMALGRNALIISLLFWLLLSAFRLGWWRRAPIALFAACALPLLWYSSRIRPEWRLDMLDIGHGLAIVVSRHGHALIYDTGNRWPGGSAARQTLLPWLSWQGLKTDEIIISHQHLDHSGGLSDMQKAWPNASVRSALPIPHHQPCIAGMVWHWQGLQFDVLWPLAISSQGGNNDSCVLRISDGRYHVLLTGDLEARAERELLRRNRQAVKADIIQVPHHGSKTSSSAPLLRNVNGSLALASVARYNAWRLPSAQIVERYRTSGYLWRDTAHSGQLSVAFYSDGWQVNGLREQILPRWYHQWFGVRGESR
ncbi:ComEC family protein [Mixta intestinalis]|uniref:ComE operon protein 3 n=1 Tax=Mixta intestinalis TaxID=1615494 RepID=A0A6P1PXF6_9GAMM|nr:ComEC family protein [Mixta intestinalis]QHM70478.1 ComE operon protein 3 [Mixta intestinalis]